MSFILDALKKSDAKRRAQLGPDWAAPTAPSATLSSQRSRPIVVWGSVGLVGFFLIASALAWWISGHGLGQNDGVKMPQALSAQPPALNAGSTEPLATQPPESSEGVDQVVSVAQSPTVGGSEPAKPMTQQASNAAEALTATQPEQRPAVPVPDPVAVEVLETRLASVSESEPEAETALEAVDVVEPGPELLGAEGETDPRQENWQPQAADYLYQWELPLAVRESLPALNLLVHVYSALPEDRFVLINGTRFREGDELSSGVRLAEIRPEGALIDFRDYRFLLSQ